MANDVFKQIVMQNSIQKRTVNLSCLNNVELLRSLDKYEKLRLIDGLKQVTMKEDEFVFN